MEEVWKLINDNHSYEISNFGRVKSIERMGISIWGKLNYPIKESIKSFFIDRDGYPMVKLWKEGKSKNVHIHRLLALHFIDNPLNLSEVNHKDGNKLNFALINLEWCTNIENSHHAVKMGLIKTGIKNNYILNLSIANQIREDFRNNPNQTKIAKNFNVSRKTVFNIINHLIYKNDESKSDYKPLF